MGSLFDVHIRRELAESLVEVVHLHQDADSGDNHEHVGRRVRELVVSAKGELQGNAERLNSHDGDGADKRADSKVDERVLLAVDRCNLIYHDDCKYTNGTGVEKESWYRKKVSHATSQQNRDQKYWGEGGWVRRTRLDSIIKDLVNSLNLFIRRRVEDDDDGAY